MRPLVFSAELDLGTLGHASVVHVRTTAGAVWGVSEAFIGYDLYDIGSTQIQGLVAGDANLVLGSDRMEHAQCPT